MNVGVEIIRRTVPIFSQVTMLTASANVLKQRLLERKLDLVITNDISTEPRRIFRVRLFDEPSILILPKALVKQRNIVWDWERLQRCGLPLISYWKESGAGMLNDLFLRSHGFVFPERFFVDNNAFMVKLVAEGIGWAFSRPTTALETEHLLSEVAIRPMQKPLLTRTVYIMGREGEFMEETKLIHEIALATIRENIIPRIVKFAPWVADKMTK